MSNDRDPVDVARAETPRDTIPPPSVSSLFPRNRAEPLGEKGEAVRLAETLALASVGKNPPNSIWQSGTPG